LEKAMQEQQSPLTRILRRIQWRLLPFLGLLYIVSFLDRVNISFAKLTMNADLGFNDSVYALGAAFFLGTSFLKCPPT
jgi:ACS family tartrate transporter-like MFS transporter